MVLMKIMGLELDQRNRIVQGHGNTVKPHEYSNARCIVRANIN